MREDINVGSGSYGMTSGSNTNWTIPAAMVGRTIHAEYSANAIPRAPAGRMFVGIPTYSIMLQVLAAKNSATKYETGFS